MKTIYFLLVSMAAAPSVALAQAAIAGAVKDGSGTPLPGVMVQAASPALIEKARHALTDSAGKYRSTSFPVHGGRANEGGSRSMA